MPEELKLLTFSCLLKKAIAMTFLYHIFIFYVHVFITIYFWVHFIIIIITKSQTKEEIKKICQGICVCVFGGTTC